MLSTSLHCHTAVAAPASRLLAACPEPCAPQARASLRHKRVAAAHCAPGAPSAARRRARAVAAAAAGPLIDPSAGKRQTVVAPRLDPSTLVDVRQAEPHGPRGLLLIGFDEAGFQAVAAWFQRMEPGFAVACCPAALLADGSAGSLRQALLAASGSSDDSSGGSELPSVLAARPWEAAPAGAPPVAFFSGMSGEEQVAILMEAWGEHTGLEAPAFAAVTPAILDKPLLRLLADIVRAQAQAPPPGLAGLSPEELEEARQQRAAAAAAATAAAAAPAEQQAPEADLRSRLQDVVMLGGEGGQGGAPMSMDQLKEQVREKMRQKLAAAAAEEKAARRAAAADETDRLRQALRGGKKAAGGKKGGGKGGNGGSGGKGFGG